MYRVRLVLVGASIVFAAGMANATTTTKIRTANIKGVGSQITGLDATTGACDTSGYDNTCPSGKCECFEISNAKITGSIAGTGQATLRLTGDSGNATTSTGGQCTPIYGIAHITSTLSKQPLTEDLNIIGALCKNFSPSGDEYIEGGFGIHDGASNSATGWGTLTGTATHSSTNNPAVTLNLKGPITE